MLAFQSRLFTHLENLVVTNEAFFSKDIKHGNTIMRVYNYRLASYTDFLAPDALEARGTMFEIDQNGKPVRLACLMPQKFFNYKENPSTMNLDLSDDNIDGVMEKLDGSIISTLLIDDKLVLKSKTSLDSDHAATAMQYLNQNTLFKQTLERLTRLGYSVHMELTSPVLRIVVGYEKVSLTVLNIRDTLNGTIYYRSNLHSLPYALSEENIQLLKDNWVTDLSIEEALHKYKDDPAFIGVTNGADFVERVKDIRGIEGFVVRLKNGQLFKRKGDHYCHLHLLKENVSAPRRLFECVIAGASDDVKVMFADDAIAIKLITDMEQKVIPIYNNIISTVEGFYEDNKHLSRKDYAIKAQSVGDDLMGLKMNVYVGRTNDYAEFAIKHNHLFGINVHVAEVEE